MAGTGGGYRSPVQRFGGTGKGSAHRAWRMACREQAIQDCGAYVEAANIIDRAIRSKKSWPFSVGKRVARSKMRRIYRRLAQIRLDEAQLCVKLGMEYTNTFGYAKGHVTEEFEPHE
jgi:hypothetical protein